MRSGRADIDADAENDNFVLFDEGAASAGEENSSALPLFHTSGADKSWDRGALLVKGAFHPARHALGLEPGLVLLADEGILTRVRDRGPAFGNVHGGVVGVLLAGRAGLAPGIVRAEPGGQPQRILRGAKMLVIPARAARRRRHHPDRLVIDPLDLVGMPILPGGDAVSFRPGIGITLACQADQHSSRRVRMGLGIPPVLVLPDPEIEGVA